MDASTKLTAGRLAISVCDSMSRLSSGGLDQAVNTP